MSCPDGSGRTFSKHVPRVAASNSFCEGEVRLLDQIMMGIMRGADMGMLVRSVHFPELAKKVASMKARVVDLRREREVEKRGQAGE